MTFKDIPLKNCYDSGIDNIIEDFYVPILSNSVTYDRIAGYFSSSSLAISGRGLSGFIKNKGKMRIICSPILDKNDIEIIRKVTSSPDTLTAIELGLDIKNIEDELTNNHVKALGWMLQEGLLDMKLAIMLDENGDFCGAEDLLKNGIFHQKVGVLHDSYGNFISFSGSINETGSAWIKNGEEFKVFTSWSETRDYCKSDEIKFEDIWNGNRKDIKIINLPKAVKEDLLKVSRDFDLDSISVQRYISRTQKTSIAGISLFKYQIEAIETWKKNGLSLLFQMATGTGKTRTAIAAMAYLMSLNEKMISIVTCPQNTLSRQWEDEIKKLGLTFNFSLIADGTNPRWRNELTNLFLRNKLGLANHCIIFTTHTTACSEDFTRIVNEKSNPKTNILFIGDECHWLGASKMRKALLDCYKYRVGLSATPSRWFDDRGTRILEDYFGNNSFELTIAEALTRVNPLTNKHFLVKYYFHIQKTSLTEDEADEYRRLTQQIVKLYRVKDTDDEAAERYERLIEKRADIVKNAENKLSILSDLLDQLLRKGEMENLIIFVSPKQITKVLELLDDKGIVSRKLTQEEGTTARDIYGGLSERQFIIKKFISKDYKVLVAIKCLDEGIDIPTACRGILLSSSTNPREYVQRIGRIIRQSENKTCAHLYDICVSSIDDLDAEANEIESKIRATEIKRLQEISSNAINSTEALSIINSIR